MLYSVFPELVNMSLTAAAVILIVALLRPLLRRAPRAVTFLLWAVVLFRLVCPISFSADFSLLRGGTTIDNRIQYLPTELIEDTVRFSEAENAVAVNETAVKAFTLLDLSRLVIVVGTWLWVVGIAVFLASGIVSLIRLHRRCLGAVETEKRVYLADHIQTPFVLGIFRPRVYLPSTLTAEEQALVLQHEKMHIRRGDPLWKLLAYLALALHWFNPIVWLGFHLFVRDMETACDERVLADMDENARADYAETLLQISVGRRFPSITPAFGEENPKTRIKSILRYKKPLKIITVAAIVFAVAFAVILFVNPKAETGKAADIIPEFPRIDDNYYYSVGVHGGIEEVGYDYSGGDETIGSMVYSFLQNMEIEVTPASESRSEARDASMVLSVSKAGNDRSFTSFCFDNKFSRVWIDNGVKPSYTYVITNPGAVQELIAYLLTGETENVVLSAAIEANHTANDAESPYITAIYCPAAQKNEAAIKIGELHAGYVSTYLCTKLSNEYGSGLDLASLDWDETIAPADTPSSPESVEFVIEEGLRVQIWKKPRLAVVRQGENERWFKTSYNDYSEAVDLVLNYSLTPTEVEAAIKSDKSENNEENPSTTPSPTDVPTATPDPMPESSAAGTSSSSPKPAASPKPTPSSSAATE